MLLNSTADQPARNHTQAAVVVGNRAAREASDSGSSSALAIVVNNGYGFDRAVLQRYGLTGLLRNN